METRRLVRAVIYSDFDEGKKYLLVKTAKDYWQNVQGGKEEGENDSDALVREIKEETNLENVVVFLNTRVFIEYDAVRKGEKIHTKLTAYAVKANHNQEIKLCSEEDGHTEYKWVDFFSALDLLVKYPEQKSVFLDVIDKLRIR